MVGDLPLPAGLRLETDLDLKSWGWTVAPTYSLSSSDRNETDVFLGARMLDIDTELGWTFTGEIGPLELPSRSGISEGSATNWDAVMGLKGHASMGANSRWILPWYVDIGTGDSDFTWQAMAGIGYRFGWGAMLLTWRHLDYDLDSGAAVTKLVLTGPMVGASFHW